MAKSQPLRFRQVHLDFHTSPWIGDVGVDFDAREFARTMKRARVDSVTVFAKCHHGMLYYDTDHPARHPGLKRRLNLLGQQVEALHREKIRAPIYISVMCDEYAADHHPEWIALEPDGRRVGRGPLENRGGAWQILDMSSPYQEYLAEQTREVLEQFKPVDGIFFDMCWNQPSASNFAKASMEREGLDPANEADRQKHAHLVATRYMARFHAMVKRSSPGASVFFNGRGVRNLREERAWQTQSEIESLPTGGWGYQFFPKSVRFARTFASGGSNGGDGARPTPYLGMTARFHKSWADFGGLKPYPALEYESSQMIAHGAGCSIGDQMHPRGTLDPAAYELIGRAYQRIEAREPWLRGAIPQAEIAILQPEFVIGSSNRHASGGPEEGAVRILTQLKQQFDLIDGSTDFGRYGLIVLPDAVRVDPPLAKKLGVFVKRGGAVLASGTSGLSEDAQRVTLPELGIKPAGFSPFQTTYLRFARELSTDVPATDHVIYERGVRVTASAGTQRLVRVVEPYFDRSWKTFSSHFQTPPARITRFAAATHNARVAYVAYPIFSAFAKHGNAPYRLLVRNLLERLLPEPLLRVAGPTGLEATVTRQGKRTIVHLLHYPAERRADNLDLIEDVIPLFEIPLSLRMERGPRRVYLAPDETPVEFEHLAGRVNLRVPEIRGHAMVVFQ